MNQQYYIVSVKHTHRDHLYITFWRPNDQGYCWALSNAGKYSDETVMAHLGYYNTGCNIAVPCDVVDAMAIPPIKGHHDNDSGPVVANNAANWRKLKASVIAPTPYPIRAQHKGARRKEAA